MAARFVSLGVRVFVCTVLLAACHPAHQQPLPLDGNAASIATELAALSPTDRALVEGYLARSGGDVLPPSMADPEEPLTARTFGEAIALQKAWLKKHGEEQAQQLERALQREAAWDRLRAHLQVELVRRERRDSDGASVVATASDAPLQPHDMRQPANVSIYRVTNIGTQMFSHLQMIVVARDKVHKTDVDCYIPMPEPLAAGAAREVACGHRSDDPDALSRYLRAQPADVHIIVRPRTLTLENGTELHEL